MPGMQDPDAAYVVATVPAHDGGGGVICVVQSVVTIAECEQKLCGVGQSAGMSKRTLPLQDVMS